MVNLEEVFEVAKLTVRVIDAIAAKERAFPRTLTGGDGRSPMPD